MVTSKVFKDVLLLLDLSSNSNPRFRGLLLEEFMLKMGKMLDVDYITEAGFDIPVGKLRGQRKRF